MTWHWMTVRSPWPGSRCPPPLWSPVFVTCGWCQSSLVWGEFCQSLTMHKLPSKFTTCPPAQGRRRRRADRGRLPSSGPQDSRSSHPASRSVWTKVLKAIEIGKCIFFIFACVWEEHCPCHDRAILNKGHDLKWFPMLSSSGRPDLEAGDHWDRVLGGPQRERDNQHALERGPDRRRCHSCQANRG